MRADWDRRARSDARYYVALGRPGQSWDDFCRGAAEIVAGLEKELERIPGRSARALEIGCGPGRLMLPLSRRFAEIHGIDVSVEMVRLARRNLAAVPHAHVHAAGGSSLSLFPDDWFDFVYSYAVFQHIPSRDVVFAYLRETRRVLMTGGLARMQFNGLPRVMDRYDTWSGVRFEPGEIAAFAREHDFQLPALEGIGTQYLWATLVKRPAGWFKSLPAHAAPPPPLRIRRITNADSPEPLIPLRGRFAAFSLWVEGLPADADRNTLRVEVGGRPTDLASIGVPLRDGVQQLTAPLPAGLSPGLHSVRLCGAGSAAHPEAFLRVIPPPPAIPRIAAVTDAVCVANGPAISSHTVRISVEETNRPEDLRATIDGRALRRVSLRPAVPAIPRFEIDFRLPPACGKGVKRLECRLGPRLLDTPEITIRTELFWWRRRLHPRELFQALRRALWERAGRARAPYTCS